MEGGTRVKVGCKAACRCTTTVGRIKKYLLLYDICKLDAWKLKHQVMWMGTEIVGIVARHDVVVP